MILTGKKGMFLSRIEIVSSNCVKSMLDEPRIRKKREIVCRKVLKTQLHYIQIINSLSHTHSHFSFSNSLSLTHTYTLTHFKEDLQTSLPP